MSIEYSNTTRRLSALVDDLETETITIPPHQRDYVWTPRQQVRLVSAVQSGMPMPNITLRSRRVGRMTVTTLEDGQQRLTTLRRYMTNAFADSRGRMFSDLSEIERARLEGYIVNVMTYSNATDEQAIEIFNCLQNGSAATVGERVFSLSRISPLVQFALEMLLTPGMGFYDRTLPLWGERTPKGQRGAQMVNAFALCACLAHGPKYLSKKWADIEDAISKPFNREQLIADLETIVSIFEEVHRQKPITLAFLRRLYWDPGAFTGYIAYSLRLLVDRPPERMLPSRSTTVATWVAFLLEHRETPEILETRLRRDVNNGRLWTQSRWDLGWRRIFDPDSFLAGAPVPVVTEEEDGDDQD